MSNEWTDLDSALEANPHLRVYLEKVAESDEPPIYLTQLSRELRELKRVNVLYPIGDPFFIHVKTEEGSAWNRYIVVQPEVPKDAWGVISLIEECAAYHLLEREVPKTTEEKAKLLSSVLDEVVVEDSSLSGNSYKVIKKHGIVKRIMADPLFAKALKHVVLMEKTALSMIEPLIRDQYIEDISCDGVGPVFVEHKVFGSCKTSIEFESSEEVDSFVYRLAEKAGRPVSIRSPIVDAQLPDGSRINIVYGSDVSRRGSNFTIRKFSDKPISITQLIKWGTISSLEAAYLWLLLENNLNVWFVGETASGKTTLLRAACTFIRPTAKIVSIEDVPEIVVPHENWVSEVTRQGQEGGEKVDLFDLLRAALRQRPNYIIVGEIRGKEAAIAFQAMQCVADAYVATPRGALLLSELYKQVAGKDCDGYVALDEPIEVYGTTLGSSVTIAKCIGLTRQESKRIRVALSDGGELIVSENHKFIVLEDGREVEVEASELLCAWRSGTRKFELGLREAPEGRLDHEANSHVYKVPTGSSDLWWAMGRLLGGDVIRRSNGRYCWIADFSSEEQFWRLRRVLEETCFSGSVELKRRGKAIRAWFYGVRPQLIHWALMNGLLTKVGGDFVGSAIGLPERCVASYLSGFVEALSASRGANKLRGKDKLEAIINMAASLATLGIASCLRVSVFGRIDGEVKRALEVLKRLGVKCGASEKGWMRGISVRAYLSTLPLVNGDGLSEMKDTLLNYFVEESRESAKLAVEYWLRGRRVVTYCEGSEVYVYLNPPKRCYVVSVEEDEPGEVYDVVLEGANYYMGGMGSCVPINDTGHGVISTFHAGSVVKLIQRLTGDPIEIPKTYVDNLNAVAIQSAVRSPKTGKVERRILSINELLGIDPETGSINYIELFSWNPSTDAHEFRGEGTSYLLEEKIAMLYGLSRKELRKIYGELNKRREFLELLISKEIFDYKTVYEAISKAYRLGVEEVMEEIRSEGVIQRN